MTEAAARVAKYSYGIYLCHTPLLWLIYQRLSMPDWQRGIWLFIAVGAVAAACYHAIEEPLIEAGTRVAGKVAMGRHATLIPTETKA
jgi:peptidoglycan/LPS O-acetylase OafA/YrhL